MLKKYESPEIDLFELLAKDLLTESAGEGETEPEETEDDYNLNEGGEI